MWRKEANEDKLCKYVTLVLCGIIGVAAIFFAIISFFRLTFEGDFFIGAGAFIFAIFDAVLIILALYGYYLLNYWFYRIAVEKGYSSFLFMRICYFVGPIGYAMIIALPDRAVELQLINGEGEESGSAKEPSSGIGDDVAHDKDAPYWCGSCGRSGPYPGVCPSCQSGTKKYNPNYKSPQTKKAEPKSKTNEAPAKEESVKKDSEEAGIPDTVPYVCGSCGHIGPYPGACPECMSGAKKYNSNFKK